MPVFSVCDSVRGPVSSELTNKSIPGLHDHLLNFKTDIPSFYYQPNVYTVF